MALDQDKLMDFIHRFVGDLGATMTAGNVVVGHKAGLYRGLAAAGAVTGDELAARTGTDARYVTEWLRGQAASGYVTYDDATHRYSLTPEQAYVLADPDGAVNAPGAFTFEHDADVFLGCEQFFRPGYAAHLVPEWLPALDGVVDKLRAGARVADVGCGLGASTVLMAREYPASRFTGSDYHAGSIETARKRASDAGVADRVSFEVTPAAGFTGAGYDLVSTFDCLHDMGDPAGAAAHIRQSLAPGGSWLIVEPAAGDAVPDNLNPVGRVYYNFSTFLCLPNARSQQGGYALGAQAGEAAIGALVREAGFSSFRRAAETPFNLVFEARA
jgi:2-polyprenyl-3-methyl-5-hydroxy-6-metoxy-1,4-benzoquinol methylase